MFFTFYIIEDRKANFTGDFRGLTITLLPVLLSARPVSSMRRGRIMRMRGMFTKHCVIDMENERDKMTIIKVMYPESLTYVVRLLPIELSSQDRFQLALQSRSNLIRSREFWARLGRQSQQYKINQQLLRARKE